MASVTYDPAGVAEHGLLLIRLLLVDLQAHAGIPAAEQGCPGRHLRDSHCRHWSRMTSQECLNVVSESSATRLNIFCDPREAYITDTTLPHPLPQWGREQ